MTDLEIDLKRYKVEQLVIRIRLVANAHRCLLDIIKEKGFDTNDFMPLHEILSDCKMLEELKTMLPLADEIDLWKLNRMIYNVEEEYTEMQIVMFAEAFMR